MRRTLVLANHFNTLRIFRRELLIELCKREDEVIVVFPKCEDEYKEQIESYGCKIEFLGIDRKGLNPIKDVKLLFAYLKLLSEYKPNKILTYTIKCNIYGGISARIKHIPYFSNITGLGTTFQNEGIVKKIVVSLYKFALKKSKTVFFQNSDNYKVFIDNKIIKESQAEITAGSGVNLSDFAFNKYPLEENGIRFLYVGRVMQEKGMDELFYVIDKVCNKRKEVKFEIVGWYEGEYEQKVKEYEQKGYLKFNSFHLDVKPFYQKCHCLIHPSWHEGMANTLLEAASVGRPLIATDICGCKEAIENGVNGYTFTKLDKEDLLRKVNMFLDLDEKTRENMGVLSRKRMEQIFDKNKVVSQMISKIYN